VVDQKRSPVRKRGPREARPSAAMREISLLIDRAEYDDVVSLGIRLLSRSLRPRDEAEVRFNIGRALVRKVDGAGALPYLTRARALFEGLGDGWMVAHVLDQEAVALLLVEDPRSLSVALTALDRSEQLDPPAPELLAAIHNTLGSIHMRAHDWRTSARFYEMGLAACEDVVNLRVAARLNDGLSLARQQLGDFTGALRSAERASALYAVEADLLGLARAENNLGYLLLREGEVDAAATHLHRALDLCDEHDLQRASRAYILNSIGELHLARREPELACTQLLRAVDVANSTGERRALASSRHHLGSAYAQLGDDDAAHTNFNLAIDLLKELELGERLRACASEYAELLHARGRLEASIAYWRIAAAAGEPPIVRPNHSAVQSSPDRG
jgi:tetratricopeptide (TPR) repeat protein